MSKPIILIFSLLFTLSSISSSQYQAQSQTHYECINIVPDSTTAKKISEILLVKRFGEFILKQKPFKVELKYDSIWVISGSKKINTPGGVAIIKINKCDGKVLEISLGK